MSRIIELQPLDLKTNARLVEIWEGAVRATHSFLKESDIQNIKKQIPLALSSVEQLVGTIDDSGNCSAFLGMNQTKIEMLFVDVAKRGQGTGKELICHAIQNMGALYVDVNEQNPQAIGFYTRMGFEQIGRSEVDDQGNPFPIIHMKLTMC